MTMSPEGGVEVRLDEPETITAEAKPKDQGSLYAKREPGPDRPERAERPRTPIDGFEDDWSDKVRARIGKERARRGDAERARDTERTAREAAEARADAAERERLAALDRATKAETANGRLYGQTLSIWERANKAEKDRVAIELREANAANAAGEDGAADRLAKAQTAAAELAAEERQLRTDKANYRPPADPKPEEVRTETRPAPERTTQPRPVHAKAQAWIDANPRFRSDPGYAEEAGRISARLLGEGKSADDDDHYAELTRRLRVLIPDSDDGDEDLDALLGSRRQEPEGEPVEVRLDEPAQARPEPRQEARRAAPVTPASRQPAGGPRGSGTVTLSADQAQIARSLGISYAQYAKELGKAQKSGQIGRNR